MKKFTFVYLMSISFLVISLTAQGNLSGDIGNMSLTPDQEWLILDSAWVEDGDTLTILPGTVVKFVPDVDAYLLIKRGGYIHAQGTETAPILFSSASDEPQQGDWLGFQILGKGTGQNPFWEVAANHNSGIIQYVNIEYSSYGFGLINLGNETQVDHISIAYSGTGFYVLGGSMNLTHLAASGSDGRGLICTGGYTGHIDEMYINGATYGIRIMNTHGAYWDYSDQNDPDAVPRTSPTISHLTMTNIRAITLRFRYGGIGNISDVVIYDYGWDWGGIRCDDAHLLANIAIDNIQHYDWHDYNLVNNNNASQVISNVVEDNPLFDGFVPGNSNGRGAMTTGDWLTSWGTYIPQNEIAHVYLEWVGNVVPGDTIETKLCFGLSEGNLLSSADLEVKYDPHILNVIDVVRVPDFFPGNEVSLVHNVTDSIIHISIATDGALDTDEAWKAASLQFEVVNYYQDTTINIDPVSILVNENSAFYTDFWEATGLVFGSFLLGDVSQSGDITSFDASLILQEIVGNVYLSGTQQWNADVSGMEGMTAYDASLIQQYMVGLIDVFPADTGSFSAPASGEVSMVDQNIQVGQMVEIPIYLDGGSNILSFEQTVTYDPDYLTFTEIEWSNYLGDFLIESNTEAGRLQFAGSGSLPDGQGGRFATLNFSISEGFVGDETAVTLERLRWNEGPVVENVTSATLSVTVGVEGGNLLPQTYKLYQNYPNPFNPTTTLRYGLPEEGNVSLIIYDVRGQVVQTIASEHQSAGWYDVVWNGQTADGKTISTGIYFARLVADDYSQVVKMLYLK